MEEDLDYKPLDETSIVNKPFNGNRLQLLRALKGLTITELAEYLGVTYVTVCSWEGTRIFFISYNNYETRPDKCKAPSKGMISRLCTYFDVFPSFFFDEKLEFKSHISLQGNSINEVRMKEET